MLALVLVPLAAPPMLLLLHAMLQRLAPAGPPQRVAIRACALGALPTGLAVVAVGARDVGSVAYVAIVYAGVAYAYFHLFNMSETARRIRLIREIDRHGSLAEAEVRRAYSDDEVVDTRLARMLAMGHLVEKDGRYVAGSPALLLAARVLDAWRSVLGYDRGRPGARPSAR